MTQTCPNCSHTFSSVPVRRKTISLEPMDTATLTEAQLYVYYKRTAPLADIEFFLRSQAGRLNTSLLTATLQLRDQITANNAQHTPDTRRAYTALLSAWRTRSLNQDIARWNAPDRQAERYGARAINAMSNYRSTEYARLASADEAATLARLAGRYARMALDGIAA